MKRPLLLSAALALGLAGVPALVAADTIQRETTEKTTTYRGTVSDIDPGSSTIILRSESSPEPMRYTFSKKTTFVDDAGNTVSTETIRNRPVTIYTTREGDRLTVSKVIVTGPSSGVIQRKETTVEEHRTD